jgi:hypothetical protein
VHPVLLVAVTAVVVGCGGLAPGRAAADGSTRGPAADVGVDAQENGEGGCVADPDFTRPCAPSAVGCTQTTPPCAQSDQQMCAAGKWVEVSNGNCCALPDGGEYWSSGDCNPSPEPRDAGEREGGEADGADDGSVDDGRADAEMPGDAGVRDGRATLG